MKLTANSFWAYELSRRCVDRQQLDCTPSFKALLCGGIAGVVTWASIFPLDVIKTRLQNSERSSEQRRLLSSPSGAELGQTVRRHEEVGAFEVAKQSYRHEGIRVFFRGLGVCSIRAFIVNAVQVRTIIREMQSS